MAADFRQLRTFHDTSSISCCHTLLDPEIDLRIEIKLMEESMTVLLMDDTRKRRGQIGELLLKKHSVIECFTSNDFIAQLETTTPDLLLLDADTWKKGAAIYHYFRIGKQLEKMPVVLYNADEETSYLPIEPGTMKIGFFQNHL